MIFEKKAKWLERFCPKKITETRGWQTDLKKPDRMDLMRITRKKIYRLEIIFVKQLIGLRPTRSNITDLEFNLKGIGLAVHIL